MKKSDAVDGCSPNIIHSLDACLLQKVALACRNASIPLWVVHDSFSTLPPYYEQMNKIIRDCFTELFDQTDSFYNRVFSENCERLISAPPMAPGERLNIREVRRSKHAFA